MLSTLFEKRSVSRIVSLPDTVTEPSYVASSYALKCQISVEDLLETYVDKIQSAQEQYLKSVAKADEYLKSNLHHSMTLQNLFGPPAVPVRRSSQENIVKAKDGSLQLKCLVPDCPVRTFKLLRHISSLHKPLQEKSKYLVELSRAMERNKMKSDSPEALPVSNSLAKSVERRASPNMEHPTKSVSRKGNFKQCSLCAILVMNISQHLLKSHKLSITEDKYKTALKASAVVPRCFVKFNGGKAFKMTDAEMKEVSNAGVLADLDIGRKTLQELKVLRDRMAEVREAMNTDPISTARLESLKSELDSLQQQYKQERYKDHRPHTANTLKWKNSFTNHLQSKRAVNPSRLASMAIDVILPYIKSTERGYTLDEVSNPRVIRPMLKEFCKSTMKSSSKIKYIRAFESLLRFLIKDIDSPENPANMSEDEMTQRDSRFGRAVEEMTNFTDVLCKDRGVEKIDARKERRKNVFSEEETKQMTGKFNSNVLMIFNFLFHVFPYTLIESEILIVVRDQIYILVCRKIPKIWLLKSIFYPAEDLNKELLPFLNLAEDELAGISQRRAMYVRDRLMAIGTLRLGRRSKELAYMTLDEVREAEEIDIKGKSHRLIEVKNQKTAHTGEPAPVAFTHDEFRVLELYIDYMRPKISSANSESVFVPLDTLGGGKNTLSLSSAWSILRKFKTESGKRLTSRVARVSRITISRSKDLSLQERQDLAKSMNHDLATANRFYDYTDIKDSVKRTLIREAEEDEENALKSNPTNVPSIKPKVRPARVNVAISSARSPAASGRSPATSGRSPATSGRSATSDRSPATSGRSPAASGRSPAKLWTSTPAKKRNRSQDTIINLRNKKIRKVDPDFSKRISEQVKEIVTGFQARGELHLLKTRTGKVAIQPINSELAADLLPYACPKLIRELVTKHL